MPRKTVKHPDGCPTCWGLWEKAKANPKRLQKTVSIELSPQEVRTFVLALNRVMSSAIRNEDGNARKKRESGFVPNAVAHAEIVQLLKPLYVLLARAAKEAL